MTERNDNNTSDTPQDWEQYGSLLRNLPERKLPNGFSARLNAAVPPRGAKASGGRSRVWWMVAPAATLATVLLVIWLGTSNFSGEEQSNRSAVASAPATSKPQRPSRTPRNRPRVQQPVVPPTDFPAPPAVASAPTGLDSMTRSLHKQELGTQQAVTGAPSTSYARGSMAVLVQ